tara:strand:+ start:1885 stop:2145 length:261 start_codon:yes stop_codon:yes gene_type:complete
MFKKNYFDKNDPMLDAINKITERKSPMRQEYIDAAKAAGQEAKDVKDIASRKEIFKKHMRSAQEASGETLPANQYIEFDKIAQGES